MINGTRLLSSESQRAMLHMSSSLVFDIEGEGSPLSFRRSTEDEAALEERRGALRGSCQPSSAFEEQVGNNIIKTAIPVCDSS